MCQIVFYGYLIVVCCTLVIDHASHQQSHTFAFFPSLQSSTDEQALQSLKERVDSLTLVMDRLVEHLAIRNLINESRTTSAVITTVMDGVDRARDSNKSSEKAPVISDSDDTDNPSSRVTDKQLFENTNKKASNLMNLHMLCNLPVNSVGSSIGKPNNSGDDESHLLITTKNAHQLLPRFWKAAIEANWSDDEKVQRLRLVSDTVVQRILDKADVFRKDWAYISALIYGQHVLDELSLVRCLGQMCQRNKETPHQWFVRVSAFVERGLPPGPQCEWAIRSSFLRGLLPKYQTVLEKVKLTSIADILSRCTQADFPSDPGEAAKAKGGSGSTDTKVCFNCGDYGHVQRRCPLSG